MYKTIEKLVEVLVDFFSEEIKSSYSKTTKLLCKQKLVLYDESLISNLLHNLLVIHISRLCSKTFIYEFHKFRKSLSLPADSTSSKAYDLYVSLIDRTMIEKWFSQYGCLRRMVTQSIINTRAYVEEAIGNFCEDIKLLCDKNMVRSGARLQKIYPLNSDPHNGSKIALCFEFDHSHKVIYKSRSLELDIVIDSIFKDILKFEQLMSPVAPTIDKGEYGWQAFIQKSPIKPTEMSEAYYNLGLCAAVFSSICTTDLHDENVIFDGTTPYFIDLETSLRPAYLRSGNSLGELMEDVIIRSVVSTTILPAKLAVIPHQILLGAINSPYPQETVEKIFRLRNCNTDAIDIAKETISIPRLASPIALTNNEPVNPLPLQANFLDGYTNGYKKLASNWKRISSVMSKIQCSVRVIVRPTVQYANMLEACIYPENLINDSAMDHIFNYLKPSRFVKSDEIAKNMLKEEIASLKNGDIPYFYIKANEKCLRSRKFISDIAFDISPAMNAIHSLENLSEKRLTLDKQFVAEGFSEIRRHIAKYTKIKDIGFQSPFITNMFKKVSKENPYPIIDFIESLAITTEGSEAETGWLGGVYGDIPISYESSHLNSLHDTGGTLLLFEHLIEYEKTQDIYEHVEVFGQAKRGLKSLHDRQEKQVASKSLSIISGSSSYDYIFNHKEDRLLKTEQVIVEMHLDKTSPEDVFMGYMGVGLLLSTFPDTNRNILKGLYDVFEKKKASFKFSKEGIAHGNLGAMWTYFRLSFALKNLDKCMELFLEAMQYSFDSPGWCNGNAGLLMVLSEMSKALNKSVNLYELANKVILLPETGSIDLSICHGAAGVLQSLLFAYATSGDHWYLALANEFWENVLDRAHVNGFCTGEENRDYLLGYFLGWSGVAESALLLKMYNNDNSSWFPLNLSSNAYQQMLFEDKSLWNV